MISEIQPEPEFTEPNWDVYHYVVGLLSLWESHGHSSHESLYYKRLCEIADILMPPTDTTVFSILGCEKRLSGEQVRYVAITLAKRAVELHWEL